MRATIPAVALLLASTPAFAVPLQFDTLAPGQAADGSFDANSISDLPSFPSPLDFLSVATDGGVTVDARITATPRAGTSFGAVGGNRADDSPGFNPDFTVDAAEPNGDLGVYYVIEPGAIDPGLELTIEFFNGTGALSNTFTNAFSFATAQIAVYDVDGSGGDAEIFRAFGDGTGLSSFQNALGSTVTSTLDSGDVLSTGGGENIDADEAGAAVVLNYRNTTNLGFDFTREVSDASGQTVVFFAIDGDVSLFDVDTEFDTPVPIPAPAPFVLLGGALALLGWRSRRKA